jgi:Fur family ferric uptake transcriptional regulator
VLLTKNIMTNNEIEALLMRHNIRPTSNRILVFKTLLAHRFPITMSEIEIHNPGFDKSSISRVLSQFRDNHLVHVIDSGDGASHYELCTGDADGNHDDEHVHFHCVKCGVVLCFQDIKTVVPELPEGYSGISVSCVVHGVCPKCRNFN